MNFAPDRSWKGFSDVALIALPVLAMTVPSADVGRPGGLRRAGGRKLVIYQPLMITLGLTVTGKKVVQRPRPLTLYRPYDS